MSKIKIGILGYGNLGKGVEIGLKKVEDMELVAVISRRDPETLDTEAPAYRIEDLENIQDEIDVLILCGSSDTDIPVQGPKMARFFNTVDSFDTHDTIGDYFDEIDPISKENQRVALIASGWDPGLFSINRMVAESILPEGESYTFWGKGISQGHSAAVRQLDGVQDAAQYTIPNEDLIASINEFNEVDYTKESAHIREVYVVLEEGAVEEEIEEAIKTMPDYFEGYETNVSFISQEEKDKNHSGMPHGGHVMRQGDLGGSEQAVYEFSLALESNPKFTAAVNIAYARAVYRLAQEENYGAKTVLDIPPAYLSSEDPDDLRRTIL